MAPLPDKRSVIGRWLALVVRYWAYNMTLIHRRGLTWLGFGYSDDEKAQLQSIAESFPSTEYYVWLATVAVIAVGIIAASVGLGLYCLLRAVGGNMASTPASLFFLWLALQAVLSLAVGLPVAMLPAAALVGRWFRVADADLPPRATTAHYFHKLWFQITRMAILTALAALPLWIFVPYDSKYLVIVRLVLPLLSPVVTVLTTAYYLSVQLKKA